MTSVFETKIMIEKFFSNMEKAENGDQSALDSAMQNLSEIGKSDSLDEVPFDVMKKFALMIEFGAQKHERKIAEFLEQVPPEHMDEVLDLLSREDETQ
jgi:hypothetical protein